MADPIAVFQRQVDAFNARDLDGFVATYAADAVVNGLGPEPVRGEDELRRLYAERFEQPARCDVVDLTVFGGRWVAVHERIASSDGAVELVGVFEVVDGAIVRADLSARHAVAGER